MTLARLLFCLLFLNAWTLAQTIKHDVCPRDDSDFANIQKKAEAKDPAAETTLASCYDLGQHVSPDGKKSIYWLTEAATQGYEPAQYELGRIYLYGRGVPADYVKAFELESKAAQQGDPRAQRDLAFMYERGLGVVADPAKSAEWNRKAALQGRADAQLQLARALDHGSGVTKNAEEAQTWYLRAARQCQTSAQLELARKLAAKSDCAGAIHWYQEAAAQGEATAAYELGKLHLGSKCARHRATAFEWLTIGARLGSAESKSEAAKLQPTLTRTQQSRALAAADAWTRKHSTQEKDEDEEER